MDTDGYLYFTGTTSLTGKELIMRKRTVPGIWESGWQFGRRDNGQSNPPLPREVGPAIS